MMTIGVGCIIAGLLFDNDLAIIGGIVLCIIA